MTTTKLSSSSRSPEASGRSGTHDDERIGSTAAPSAPVSTSPAILSEWNVDPTLRHGRDWRRCKELDGKRCVICKAEAAAYMREYRKLKPRKPSECGSHAGYVAHKRAGEDACDECKAAHSRYSSSQRAMKRLDTLYGPDPLADYFKERGDG